MKLDTGQIKGRFDINAIEFITASAPHLYPLSKGERAGVRGDVLRCSIIYYVRIGIVVVLIGVITALLHPDAAWPLAQNNPEECIAAAVENITYNGEDRYLIRTTVSNRSTRPLIVKESDLTFSVQTETGWKTLSPATAGRADPSCDLEAGAKKTISRFIKIPLRGPGLFRTFEGDVSLSMEYRVNCSDDAETRMKEQLYWLTPGTDKWILREGM